MKFFKKNQIILYVIALMLITAGYLSYTTESENIAVGGNVETAETKETEAKNIGDAQLVSSNDIVNEEEKNNTNANDTNSQINTINNENIDTTNNTVNTENTSNTQNTVNQGENTSQQENQIQETSSQVSDEYFTKSKLERDTMYSQMLETYEKILNSSNALETQKQSATEEITKINNTKNSIMICENLIGTKGFQNNVIFVNGDSITAIIGATELKQEEVAQIQNIISREMGASIENIHIAIK